MSKYIPKSRIKTPIPSSYEWASFPPEKEEYVNPYIAEKGRIEAIPLEELTFKDLYEFPFRQAKYGSWVYDKNSNFIFQFEFRNEETRQKVIDILNGNLTEYKRQDVRSEGGMIYINDNPFILIRGWGNLTGVGAYNLNGDHAAKIQDTLEQYIIEKLTK